MENTHKFKKLYLYTEIKFVFWLCYLMKLYLDLFIAVDLESR